MVSVFCHFNVTTVFTDQKVWENKDCANVNFMQVQIFIEIKMLFVQCVYSFAMIFCVAQKLYI